MRFDDRVQAYADKLLAQSQKKIEADHKKNIEAVFLGLSGKDAKLDLHLNEGCIIVAKA
jgi:hypothetical protein